AAIAGLAVPMPLESASRTALALDTVPPLPAIAVEGVALGLGEAEITGLLASLIVAASAIGVIASSVSIAPYHTSPEVTPLEALFPVAPADPSVSSKPAM